MNLLSILRVWKSRRAALHTDLEVGDGQPDRVPGGGARLHHSGHLVLLHGDPVVYQTGLLQLLDLGAESDQNSVSGRRPPSSVLQLLGSVD